jgi:hypothetical protein
MPSTSIPSALHAGQEQQCKQWHKRDQQNCHSCTKTYSPLPLIMRTSKAVFHGGLEQIKGGLSEGNASKKLPAPYVRHLCMEENVTSRGSGLSSSVL